MEAVVLNSFRHEDPAVILCPVRSVCVAAVSSLLFLNRVLGLGDPKMLSPRPVWAMEVGWADSPQDGCRSSLGPLSWRRGDVESSISQVWSVTVCYQILLCSVGELVERNGSPSPQQPHFSLWFKWQNVPEHRHPPSICLTAGGLDLWHGEENESIGDLCQCLIWSVMLC